MTHTSEISPVYVITTRWGWRFVNHRALQGRPMSYYYTIPLVKRKPHDA